MFLSQPIHALQFQIEMSRNKQGKGFDHFSKSDTGVTQAGDTESNKRV